MFLIESAPTLFQLHSACNPNYGIHVYKRIKSMLYSEYGNQLCCHIKCGNQFKDLFLINRRHGVINFRIRSRGRNNNLCQLNVSVGTIRYWSKPQYLQQQCNANSLQQECKELSVLRRSDSTQCIPAECLYYTVQSRVREIRVFHWKYILYNAIPVLLLSLIHIQMCIRDRI